MAEYSRIARGHFTSTGMAQKINLPFQPDYVELTNYTVAASAATSQNIAKAVWDATTSVTVSSVVYDTVIQGYNTTPALIYDVIAQGQGISTFSAGLLLQYGPIYQHTGSTDFQISTASPAVVTTTTNHNLATGDVIEFANLFETTTTGMPQICGIPFMVTRTGATTFTINWNTNQSNYTAFNTATSTGNVGSFRKVLYPNLYLPQDVVVSGITTGSTTTISTSLQHNMHVGQEVAFRIPNVWGTTQLNSLPDSAIPGSPIYGYVVSITDAQDFVVSINSTGYTAYNSNQPVNMLQGLTFPQVVGIGDVNSGGVSISAGSPLYPSPQFTYATTDDSNTINGPAIRGAFVNNTSAGFIVGTGAGKVLTTGNLVGASGNIIYWRAFLSDYSAN